MQIHPPTRWRYLSHSSPHNQKHGRSSSSISPDSLYHSPPRKTFKKVHCRPNGDQLKRNQSATIGSLTPCSLSTTNPVVLPVSFLSPPSLAPSVILMRFFRLTLPLRHHGRHSTTVITDLTATDRTVTNHPRLDPTPPVPQPLVNNSKKGPR